MTILITGAAGFVGQNLVEYLEGRYSLLCPSQNELDFLNELAVENYFKQHAVDIVVHLANVGATRRTDNLPQIVGNNLRMFLNIKKQEHRFKRMIFFGSGAEFDKRQSLSSINESYASEHLPEGDYGLSKFLCSHFIEESQKIVNLRMFGIYGKYDDYENRFISNAICRAVLGLPIKIFQDQVMSFIYVEDLVKIVEHFILNSPREKFYNVASSESLKLTEIAEKIIKLSKQNVEIKILKPGWANEYTCNNSRLLGELGRVEFTTIDKSLADLYAWYSENKSSISQEKLI
ncbi:MAG: NAD(P)-dependent oxidoreductase [Candidatus Doudnabacteria bacterium]|nr:NAD(P)-dependent oxidoreductase [Candidatus Doudnabacteria bacterium]